MNEKPWEQTRAASCWCAGKRKLCESNVMQIYVYGHFDLTTIAVAGAFRRIGPIIGYAVTHAGILYTIDIKAVVT